MSAFTTPIVQAQSIAASFKSKWINVRTFKDFAIQFWLDGSHTPATVTGTSASFGTVANGETAVLGVDADENLTITFLTGDTTGAKVVTRINAAFLAAYGYSIASLATGELKLTSPRSDGASEVRVVSGSTGLLAKLGLTAATTAATSTAAGAVSYEVSCEDNPSIANRSGETALNRFIRRPIALTTISTVTITAGAPYTGFANFVDQNFKWVRLVWAASSGTGTLDAMLVAKGGIP
jgi:hypothetical protein